MNRITSIPAWQLGAYAVTAAAGAYAAKRWGLGWALLAGFGMGLAADLVFSPRGTVEALEPTRVG